MTVSARGMSHCTLLPTLRRSPEPGKRGNNKIAAMGIALARTTAARRGRGRGGGRDGALHGRGLLGCVGAGAGRRRGLPPPVLDADAQADLVHLSRPVWEAEASDVALVVVAGVPRLGDERFAELFERTGVAVERLDVQGTCKLVAAPLATILERVLEDWPQLGPALGLRAEA